MWESVDLREIRVLLALAEELHFGRAAERVQLTQSRVSQSLRSLERKLGTQLVHRTSRKVALTAAGERLVADLEPAYAKLADVLEAAEGPRRDRRRALRLGVINATAGGPALLSLVEAFEAAHPGARIEILEVPFRERFDRLRHGDVHLLASWLPLERPGLVAGPVFWQEPRVLAVGAGHPLAQRSTASIEVLGDHPVASFDRLPADVAPVIPARTPAGRAIARAALEVQDVSELIVAIARGTVVHPTVQSFAHHYAHPRIVYLPITDDPPQPNVLVRREDDDDPLVLALCTGHAR